MRDRKLDRLFERFRSKSDVSALGEVFDRAAPELLRVSRHLCRDVSEAEDVVQATFLTALTKSDSYDPSRRVLPWLIGILALHAREMQRKAGRCPDPDRVLERNEQDPLDSAADTEFQRNVSKAVQTLPDTYRGVLFAHLAEGKGPSEVAEQFGLSPVAARVRLHRGMKLLRKALPAGYAGALATVVLPGRGLAAVRAEVLAEAARQVPAGSLTLAAGSGAAAAGSGAAAAGSGAAGAGAGALGASAGLAPAGGAGLAWIVGAALALPTLFWAQAALGPGGAPEATDGARALVVAEESASDQTLDRTLDGGALAALEGGERQPPQPEAAALDLRRTSGRLIDADSRAPIAGAVLRFWWPEASAFSEPYARVETDENGRFLSEAVPMPSALLVTAEGHACLRRFSSLTAAPLEAAAHAPVELGELELARGAEPVGIALDALGQAAGGAQLIAAAPFLDWYGQPAILQEIGMTDHAGRWRIEAPLPYSASRYATVSGLAPGECHYLIVASNASGLGLAELLVREQPLGATGEQAAAALERTSLQFAPARPLLVRVRDGAGVPIQQARLWIEPQALQPFLIQRSRDPVPAMHPALARHLKAKTNTRGEAVFESLPFTTGRDATWTRMTIFAVGENESLESHLLSFEERQRGEVELVLRGSSRQLLRGEVTNGSGAGIAGARIHVGEQLEIESDDAGLFELYLELGEFVDGQFELRVEADGYRARRATLDAGAFEGSLLLALEPAWDELVTSPLVGTVLTADGLPAEGLEVVLDSARSSHHGWTDSGGRFVLARSGPGEHRLRVVTTKASGAWVEPLLIPDSREVVEVRLHAIELQDTQLLATVVHARSMEAFDPDRAALLSLEDGTAAPVELILGVGHVRAKRLPVGHWRLWVGRHGAGIGTVDLEVTPGDTRLDTQVVIQPSGALEGRLRHHPGAEPCERVTLRRMGETVPSELRSDGWAGYHSRLELELDTEGRFAVQNLIPGPYRLEAGPDGARGRTEVEVESGRRARVTWSSRPTSRVRFELADFESAVLESAVLESAVLESGSLDSNRGPLGGARLSIETEEGQRITRPYFDRQNLLAAPAPASEALSTSPAGSVLSLELPCGPLSWRLEFPSNGFAGSEARWRAAREGQLLLEAGSPQTIRIER